MSEIIISKKCCSCKQIKNISEFWKCCTRKDGLQTVCKNCQRIIAKKYAQSDKGRIVFKKAQNQFKHSIKGKITIEKNRSKYLKTKNGRAYRLRNAHIYKKRYPKKFVAIQKVHSAIKSGKIPHISKMFCFCSKKAREYHHYLGYSPEHWFDILPLCYKCHKIIHRPLLTG